MARIYGTTGTVATTIEETIEVNKLGIDLMTQTKAQLIELAGQLDIPAKNWMTKAQIIEKIEANLENVPEDEAHDEELENEDEMEDDEIEHKFGSAGAKDDETFEVPAEEEHDESVETEEETEAVIEELENHFREATPTLVITEGIRVIRQAAKVEITEDDRVTKIRQLMAWKAETLDDLPLQKKIRQALRDLNHFQYLGAYYRHNPISIETAVAMAAEKALDDAVAAS
jgi:hypothetical protein